MQQFTAKLWSAAGMVATAVAVAATPAPAAEPYKAPEQMFPGNFDRALELMLMGEGGEAGIGMHRVWPTASVPALSTEQIRKTIPGNTLAIEHHYSLQFKPDGTIGGYHLAYSDAPVAKCPKQEVLGDGFLMHEGKCNIRKEMPWPAPGSSRTTSCA